MALKLSMALKFRTLRYLSSSPVWTVAVPARPSDQTALFARWDSAAIGAPLLQRRARDAPRF
eukprot:10781215-Alexandrium_andersonii.AAC.1